jgi:glutathione S-transferase
LGEKNLQSRVQFVPVSLRKGEHKKPEFLAKNYSGTLPVLELDDGTLIAECTAIPNTSTRLMALPHSPVGQPAKRA